jgi:hypothetical protein
MKIQIPTLQLGVPDPPFVFNYSKAGSPYSKDDSSTCSCSHQIAAPLITPVKELNFAGDGLLQSEHHQWILYQVAFFEPLSKVVQYLQRTSHNTFGSRLSEDFPKGIASGLFLTTATLFRQSCIHPRESGSDSLLSFRRAIPVPDFLLFQAFRDRDFWDYRLPI